MCAVFHIYLGHFFPSEVCKQATDGEPESLRISDCDVYARTAAEKLQDFLEQGKQGERGNRLAYQ